MKSIFVLLHVIIEVFRIQAALSTNHMVSSLAKYGSKRLNEFTWLVAHNAHLNWHDSSVIEFASNQALSLDKQLKHGVRGFMFDIDMKTCSSLDKWLGTCQCEGILTGFFFSLK